MVRSVDGEYKIVKSKFIEFTKCQLFYRKKMKKKMFISDNSKISKFTVNKLSEFLEHVQPSFNNIPAVSHAPFFKNKNPRQVSIFRSQQYRCFFLTTRQTQSKSSLSHVKSK